MTDIVLVIFAVLMTLASVVIFRSWLTHSKALREMRSDTMPHDAMLERYHDHVTVLASALDDAVFDACKQAGVPACDGREVAVSELCSLSTVHTRTVQVAHLLVDMVRDMGSGAEQAAEMVQLLGDALSEVVRPVVKAMDIVPVPHEPSGNPGELSVVLTGPSLSNIVPGLYELGMNDGSRMQAAVGRCRGEPWFAPLMIEASESMYDVAQYDWSQVVGATLIRAVS